MGFHKPLIRAGYLCVWGGTWPGAGRLTIIAAPNLLVPQGASDVSCADACGKRVVY